MFGKKGNWIEIDLWPILHLLLIIGVIFLPLFIYINYSYSKSGLEDRYAATDIGLIIQAMEASPSNIKIIYPVNKTVEISDKVSTGDAVYFFDGSPNVVKKSKLEIEKYTLIKDGNEIMASEKDPTKRVCEKASEIKPTLISEVKDNVRNFVVLQPGGKGVVIYTNSRSDSINYACNLLNRLDVNESAIIPDKKLPTEGIALRIQYDSAYQQQIEFAIK